jgi:hypothetical protein
MSVGIAIVMFLPLLLILGNAGSASASVCSNPARKAFSPSRAAVANVGRSITVLALGRTAGGFPGLPPLTSSGKKVFAWDREGPKPGSAFGNVRFNAHTWPDGSALGNRLLARLKVGNRIVLYGDGVALCYRVNRKVVTTPNRLGGYYSTTGKPKLAIVVCSGRRLGPGNWTNRTIWYAKPVTS